MAAYTKDSGKLDVTQIAMHHFHIRCLLYLEHSKSQQAATCRLSVPLGKPHFVMEPPIILWGILLCKSLKESWVWWSECLCGGAMLSCGFGRSSCGWEPGTVGRTNETADMVDLQGCSLIRTSWWWHVYHQWCSGAPVCRRQPKHICI